jgi:hypothetical protein
MYVPGYAAGCPADDSRRTPETPPPDQILVAVLVEITEVGAADADYRDPILHLSLSEIVELLNC